MSPKRSTSRAHAGFTLMELLVAIGIMILIMGITMPFIAAIGRGTGMANTSNEISASLVAARAVAMKEGKDAAIVFEGSGVLNEGPIKCTIVLRTADTTNPGFAPYEKRDGIKLPPFCRVAGMTALTSGDLKPEWLRPATTVTSAFAPNLIGICFGSDGRVKNLDSALTGNTVYYDEDDNISTPATAVQKITFVPVLATYEARTLLATESETTASGLRSFINTELADINTSKRVRILYFDSYTGQVLR